METTNHSEVIAQILTLGPIGLVLNLRTESHAPHLALLDLVTGEGFPEVAATET